ncbi:uncharacterized protein LOC111888645 [Lactuca sativa]|uniref:uncharacterized protein LOC111888645 n=1 Tax=Lactuca sativa TaxID=4236 RepID=UPI000CD849C3|nr:uncharacterized protein LOC111888645 [Lactuca sativa]
MANPIDSTGFTTIDPSNPFFIAPSDNPSSILITNPFNGIGFASWKQSMLISLASKNKLGFIDGSISEPTIISNSYSAWFRANSMVISWILNSLSKNSVDSVLFFVYCSRNLDSIVSKVRTTIWSVDLPDSTTAISTSQGSDDFGTYFTKLTRIWDELCIVQAIPPCSCDVASQIHKFLEE